MRSIGTSPYPKGVVYPPELFPTHQNYCCTSLYYNQYQLPAVYHVPLPTGATQLPPTSSLTGVFDDLYTSGCLVMTLPMSLTNTAIQTHNG